MPEQVKWLSAKEVSEDSRLNVSVDYIIRAFDRGELDAINLATGKRKRKLRFDPASVERFIQERMNVGRRHELPTPAQMSRPRPLPGEHQYV